MPFAGRSSTGGDEVSSAGGDKEVMIAGQRFTASKDYISGLKTRGSDFEMS